MAKNTSEMSRQEWLWNRKSGIGGSDSSTILGFNAWKSPFELYIDKTSEEVQEIDNEAIHWGNVLEDVVAEEFTRRTGKKVRRRNQTFRHPDYDFMIANIDRDVVGENALLECKTTNAFNSDAWEGEHIPPAYICQLQHYMAVLDYEKAYIAVLIGGQKFVWKEVDRDDEFIELMIEQEKHFWEEHVLKEIPPEIDGTKSASELLNKMYPEDNGETIMLKSDDAEMLIEAIESIKSEVKEKQSLQKEYENKLKMMVGDAQTGVTPRFEIKLKTVKSNRLDSKSLRKELPDIAEKYTNQSTSRRLTIKQIEQEAI
ncbi:YqaJ viral recombinase family protein [Oceanobacillus oncorhynchi]|uniref:YqaJ viral recombinase family nuclease n=1 Tax=Oceanobacillus oncorhynchi TaxID=545501 RepID=UPI0021167804|nr:YqaJ viral recombinase family protein [Oceanobacillus oncorhynchi]UUI41150.1 YqaJ viral recombinase family protein [Oceanobacillus oncorhynchi]